MTIVTVSSNEKKVIAQGNQVKVIKNADMPTLATLPDVVFTSLTDNDFLVYNGTKWTNEVPATARTSLGLGTIAVQDADNVTIAGSLSGSLLAADQIIESPQIKDYSETNEQNATATGSVTVDFEDGNIHELTLTGNITTLTISNPPSSPNAGNMTLLLRQGGSGSYTISWPASVKWAGSSAPTLSTAVGSIDMVFLITTDGGTNYYASSLINFG